MNSKFNIIFIFLISINLSFGDLNLFRPYKLTRQIKLETNESINKISTNDQSNQEKIIQQNSKIINKQNNKLENDNHLNQEQHLKQEQHIKQEQHLNQEQHLKQEQHLNQEQHIKQELDNHLEDNKNIKSNNQHIKQDQSIQLNQIPITNSKLSKLRERLATKKHRFLSTNQQSKDQNDNQINLKTNKQLNKNSSSLSINLIDSAENDQSTNDNHTRKKRSNELLKRESNELHSVFRTFDSIIDFLINTFDELAEAIVSRGAVLVINSIFDRASMFFFGI